MANYVIRKEGVIIGWGSADPENFNGGLPDGFSWEHYAEPAGAPPPWARFIDIGPFFDRFGAAKMAVLTSTDTGVKAVVTDCTVRKWIDLQRADVVTALAYIGSVVPAVDAALRAAILTTPVGDHENLALRKLYFGTWS